MTDEQIRELAQTAFKEGATQMRAAVYDDLRQLADDFTTQLFELRQEIWRALKLPPLASPDDTLQ